MQVTFPGLGWAFTLNPVAFSIGSLDIYWYAVCITLGLVLAVIYAYWQAPTFGINRDKFLDVAFFGFFGGIVGARAYYVINSWDTFKGDWKSIFNFRTGGMAIYGCIIGGFLVGYIACRVKKMKFAPIMDVSGMGFLIGQAIGRWGNFFNQEAFGTNTALPWGMHSQGVESHLRANAFTLSEIGVTVDPTAPVHPCFFYEFLWCAIGFLLLHLYRKHRHFDGEMFLMYIGWYGLGRFFIEGLRTDPLLIGRLRVSQLVAAACVVAAAAIWFYIRSKMKASGNPDYLKPVGMLPVPAEGDRPGDTDDKDDSESSNDTGDVEEDTASEEAEDDSSVNEPDEQAEEDTDTPEEDA